MSHNVIPGKWDVTIAMRGEGNISFFNVDDDERDRIEQAILDGRAFSVDLNKKQPQRLSKYVINPECVAYVYFRIQPEPMRHEDEI